MLNRNAVLAAVVAGVLLILTTLGFTSGEIQDAFGPPDEPPTTTEPPVTTTEQPTTTTVSPPSTTMPPSTTTSTTVPPTTTTVPEPPVEQDVVFFCDYTAACPSDNFVQYRDNFLVSYPITQADHALAADWTIENQHCTAPEETRTLDRNLPHQHIYRCVPGGNPDAAHQMCHVPDNSGYNFCATSPNLVLDGVQRISFDVNMTTAGARNFWEVAIIPAENAWTDGMPCIPEFPCNDGFDYADLGAVGFGTANGDGTGFRFEDPNGQQSFNGWAGELLDNGDVVFPACGEGFCQGAAIHRNTTSVRDRFGVIIEDRGVDGVWFGMEQEDGSYAWVNPDTELPEGPVRVVLKFHGYTNTKEGSGPGFRGNESPSVGGFTWHWDNLLVTAEAGLNSESFYTEDAHADRFVTHPYPGCIAFAEGRRGNPNPNSGILPIINCPEGIFGEYLGDGFVYGPIR